MTRESQERQKRLRDDLEQLRSEQEQTLGTLGTRIDAIMERRFQAVMDRLYGPLGNRSGWKKREAHSRVASIEPRVNFKEHSNRGTTNGFTRGRGNPSSGATGSNRPKNPTNTRGDSTGSRPISTKRPARYAHANGRGDSSN